MATGQVTKEIVTKSKLDNLANSISTKSGVSTPMTIDQMKVAVEGIISGTKGAIYQDEQGYLVVAKDADIPIQIDSLTVTQDGTYTAPANHAYNPVVVNTAPAPPTRYVKFIDYDGTLLHTYTHAQFNALSAMPSNPSHTGLVAQGWNWTLSDAKEQIAAHTNDNLIIGQLYTTTSGKTQIDIQLEDGALSPCFLIYFSNNSSSASIDWGDNSTQDIISSYDGSGTKKVLHNYASSGSYTISVQSIVGTYRLTGYTGSSGYAFLCRDTTYSMVSNVIYANAIKAVRFGNNVFFNSGAFNSCRNLLYVTISTSCSSSGFDFRSCCKLKSITVSPGITTIPYSAFVDCYNLKNVSLPKSISYFNSSNFSCCFSLQDISIPSGADISSDAFNSCFNLKNITVPSLSGSQIFYNCYNLQSVVLMSGISYIDYGTFYGCHSLQEITIPSGVTSIGSDAFQSCYSLQEITIPSTVTTIGEGAFYSCSSLKEIIIPNGVTSIGQNAFYYCYSLQEITLPNTITSIDSWTFCDCCSLQEITIPSGVTSIGSGAFYDCHSLQEITIPNTVTSIGSSAFYYCYSLQKITIPSGVTSIDSWTFYDCYSLQEIIIPNTVTSIGSSAFNGCHNLQQITLSNNIETIDSCAFQYCSSLQKIILSNTITTIAASLFYCCYTLSNVDIPNTVIQIDGTAFYQCNGLTKMTIPANVTSIGNGAFNYCWGLQEIHLLPTTPPTLGGTSVFSNTNNCPIYVPQGSLSAYQSATNWSSYASRIQEEPT